MAVNGDWIARLEALTRRVDASLVEAQRSRVNKPSTGPDEAHERELETLATKLRDAELEVGVQQRRSNALEDRVAELAAALVGATEQRRQAEALAESNRQRAELAIDQLEASLREQERTYASAPVQVDAGLSNALQTKLLEVERLTSEVTDLRRSNDDWRTKARSYRRDLDRVTLELQQASAQLPELRARDEASRKRLAELERLVTEQKRELDLAERRAQHLRQRLA